MNESLTTVSHTIAALPLTRNEGGEPVESSGQGLGTKVKDDEETDVFPPTA